MNIKTACAITALTITTSIASAPLLARGDSVYEVTITNLTLGQPFSPPLVASHKRGVTLFTAGQEASDELATLAETGNATDLKALLEEDSRVKDVTIAGDAVPPGKSITITVMAKSAKYISVAAMLVNTNDAFMALNGVAAPRYSSTTYRPPAYDAGSEFNDELCDNIPGPACEGSGAPEGGEGYVYISNGIHGIGDLEPASYDWHNPVALITIRKSY